LREGGERKMQGKRGTGTLGRYGGDRVLLSKRDFGGEERRSKGGGGRRSFQRRAKDLGNYGVRANTKIHSHRNCYKRKRENATQGPGKQKGEEGTRTRVSGDLAIETADLRMG